MIIPNVPGTPDKLEEAKDIIAAMSLVKNEVIDPDTGATLSRGTGSIVPKGYDLGNRTVDAETLQKISNKDKEEITETANAYWQSVMGRKDMQVNEIPESTEEDLTIKVGKIENEDSYMASLAAATSKHSNMYKRNRITEDEDED